MAKYSVELYYTTHCTVEVETEDESQVEDLAWEEAQKGDYDTVLASNCVHDFVGDITKI